MKLRNLLFALALCLPASAISIVTQPFLIGSAGHAGARLVWVSDTNAFIRWGYDTTSHSGASSSTAYANHFTSNLQHFIMGMYVSGLTASTTYFFRGCAYNSPTEVCGSEISFTTAALPSPHPALPVAPTAVDVTLPTCANGRLHCSSGLPVTHTVGSNCDDPSTGLQALWNASDWGDTISIPTTTVCRGYYKLDSSHQGIWPGTLQMVVKSANAGFLPAQITPSNETAALTNMPQFYETVWPMPGAQTLSQCYAGGYYWDGSSSTPGFYLNYCGIQSTGTVSNVVPNASCSGSTSTCAVFNVTLSSGLSTLPTVGQWGYETSIGGLPKANGTFNFTTVTDSSHFTVTMLNGYNTANGQTYTSGGTLNSFAWQNVTYFDYSGTPTGPTSGCTAGTGVGTTNAWAYANVTPTGSTLTANLAVGNFVGSTYSTQRVWRCQGTAWVPYYIEEGAPKQQQAATAAVIDVSASQHIRFIGIAIDHYPVFQDPLLYRGGPGGNAAYFQGGSGPEEYVLDYPGTSQDLIFDRCIVTREWPAKGDQLLQMDGDNIAVINSYFKADADWWGKEEYGPYWDNAAGDMISTLSGGPKLLQGNYIEAYGISAHFNDGGIGWGFAGSIHDVTVQQNTFFRDFTKIYLAPGYTVDYYMPLRQILEFKSGLNALVNGNIFNGNFRNVSQGAAIALTPEAYIVDSAGFFTQMVYSGGTGTITNLQYSAGPEYTTNVGDWVVLLDFDPTHIYQVASVSGGPGSTFTVSGLPAGSATVFTHVQVITGNEGVANMNITNNTFENVPNGIDMYSHISHDSGAFRRSEDQVQVLNNIWNQIGPGGSGTGPLEDAVGNWQCSGSTGSIMYGQWGGQVDVIFNHNTVYQFNPSAVNNAICGVPAGEGTLWTFFNNDFPQIDILEGEGLQVINNMYWTSNTIDPISANSVSGATCPGNGFTVMTCFQQGNLPFSYTKDVHVLSGGYPGGYNTSSNYWVPYSGATSPFASPSTNNMTLTPGGIGSATSTCFGLTGDCTTDGTDSGVSMPTLNAAQQGLAPLNSSVIGSGLLNSGKTVVH